MTRNRFNQAKQQSTSTSMNNLTLSKAHLLFLEDNDNIDMKDTYKITNVHPPIDQKDVVNKKYCDNNQLSSNNKIDILSKNITELRKGKFDQVTIGQLNANIIGLPSSSTNGDTVWIDGDTVELVSLNSSKISTLANKITEIETNIVHFGNKVSADTISKYNEIKVEFDNNKVNQSITNIQLRDTCVDRWRCLRENHILMMKIILESKLVGNKEQARLEMRYDFKQEHIMKDIILLLKMSQPTAPSERLLYPDLSSVSERLINEKIQANNKINNNTNIIKDIRIYYETETDNYNKKLS